MAGLGNNVVVVCIRVMCMAIMLVFGSCDFPRSCPCSLPVVNPTNAARFWGESSKGGSKLASTGLSRPIQMLHNKATGLRQVIVACHHAAVHCVHPCPCNRHRDYDPVGLKRLPSKQKSAAKQHTYTRSFEQGEKWFGLGSWRVFSTIGDACSCVPLMHTPCDCHDCVPLVNCSVDFSQYSAVGTVPHELQVHDIVR